MESVDGLTFAAILVGVVVFTVAASALWDEDK